MIYLQFPKETAQIQNWRERLDQLIVGYKSEWQPHLDEPVITEDQRVFTGTDAIEKYLMELEAAINDWRTPRCGV